MTTDVAAAYDDAAQGWRRGPEAVYARLAAALVTASPVPVSGASVLDVGAGTAVAGRAALDAGAATVTAADIATRMLELRDRRIGAVCADAARLPFADGSFDLALAGFCLGHLPDPARALRETRRVAGAVAASAFQPGWTHPAKTAVDEVMAGFGFVVPAWYQRVKTQTEPAVNDAGMLERLARAAGWTDVRVERREVDSGLASASEIVGWRLGMAHLAPFVSTLAAPVLAEAVAASEAAVAGTGPVLIPILVLSAS